jgi:hypothetical protein
MYEKNNHEKNKIIGVGIAIGIGIMVPFGIILGVSTGNMAFIGFSLPIGIAVGTAIGAAFNERHTV